MIARGRPAASSALARTAITSAVPRLDVSSSDLRHGEIDFGLPIAIVVLLLVFGAVVAGLMPVLMALVSIVVGLGIATVVLSVAVVAVLLVHDWITALVIGVALAKLSR